MHARARALLRACGLSVALGALALPSGAQAQTVHKCRVNGQLVYQQAPCAHASQRETLSEDGISVIGGNPAPAQAEAAPTPRPRAKPESTPSPAATRRTVNDEQRQEERAERERSGLCVKLRDALGPWSVAGPALAIGEAALRDEAWADTMRRQLQDQSDRLDRLLAAAGYTIVGGTTLFRLIRHPAAASLHARLARHHIWSQPPQHRC